MKANTAIWFNKIGKNHQPTAKHIDIEEDTVFVVCLLNYVIQLSTVTYQEPYTQAWWFYGSLLLQIHLFPDNENCV